ncbi:MAG: hypothetical protein Q4G18_03360 [Myroides sp.]|nr:hypothetical protein [Myroides sp.]
MSFISDLLIEISSFRIRVGNKLNALANRIGNLTALTTTNQNDLVGAINEVNGSLDDYLPKVGGTMVNNSTVNWQSDGRLTINNQNRLVMNSINTFISGGGSGGLVYFRPNGHASASGQVTIDGNGQINAVAHGNSSQWKQAFDWGDHNLAGYYKSNDVNIPALGGDYRVFPWGGTTELFDFNNITGRGFYKNIFNGGAASTYNAPKSSGYWYVENILYSTTGNLTQYAHPYRVSDGKWMRSKFGNTWTAWVEFIHSGNISTHIPITSISRNGANIPIISQNVNIPLFSTSGAGLVPARVGSVATKYLREDGTWVTPTNTTYSAGTLELLQAGTNATNRVWSAVVLGQRFNQFQSTMAYINTDTGNIDSNVDWGTNVLAGARNQVQGARNIVKGEDINIFGSRNVSSGINNQINGFANVANGAFNTVNGAYSSIAGSQANTIGNYLFARDKQTVLGMYNKVYNVGDDEGLRVAVGTGSNDFDKFNSVEIYDDHRTEFHGKAAYDEETRNPEWFTEDYTHVDTYQVGYDHLTHSASSSTPCEHNILEVAVRGNDRFVRVQAFELAFNIHGIVKGNLIEGNIDRTKVHTKGTLQFSDAVRTELLARADISKNPYLVVEYIFDKEEIYVKYVGAFYLKEAKRNDDRIVYIIGNFINKRGSGGQPDITYFEFNQQII